MSKPKGRARRDKPAPLARRKPIEAKVDAQGPQLGIVVAEVRRQSQAIDALSGMLNVPKSVAFVQELAGHLGLHFSGEDDEYKEIKQQFLAAFSDSERATRLDETFGRLAMILGEAGHLKAEHLLNVARCYSSLRTELKEDDPQKIVDRVRELLLKST